MQSHDHLAQIPLQRPFALAKRDSLLVLSVFAVTAKTLFEPCSQFSQKNLTRCFSVGFGRRSLIECPLIDLSHTLG